jgi:hypothetical protein
MNKREAFMSDFYTTTGGKTAEHSHNHRFRRGLIFKSKTLKVLGLHEQIKMLEFSLVMMLGTGDRWRFIYKWLTIGQVIAAAALSFASVATRLEIPAGSNGPWYEFLGNFLKYAIYVVAISNVVLWVAFAVKKYFGTPFVWETVKVLLEEFRAEVFQSKTDLSALSDRVTLFKKYDRRWRYFIWPSHDWLCAVERTGHMTRRRRIWFRCHDDGQQRNGVAGATWCEGRTILKDGLPLLTPAAPEKEVELYAQQTFVDVKRIKQQQKQGHPLARLICGIMVEVNSKPWGVIVIDSSTERLIKQEEIESFYRKNANILGKLLDAL